MLLYLTCIIVRDAKKISSVTVFADNQQQKRARSVRKYCREK